MLLGKAALIWWLLLIGKLNILCEIAAFLNAVEDAAPAAAF
jgi:hypothetical protein